jgi:hypothetical protein
MHHTKHILLKGTPMQPMPGLLGDLVAHVSSHGPDSGVDGWYTHKALPGTQPLSTRHLRQHLVAHEQGGA